MTSLPRLVGIIGYPLRHTLSPQMHEAAFRKLKLNFRYIPFEVPPHKLSSAIQGMRALDFAGFNVTIPHKEAVLEFCDELDSTAQKIGAVNTVCLKDGKLTGHNTDASGFISSLLKDGTFDPRGKKAVVFGAGGAARAITAALAMAGTQRIVITDVVKSQVKMLGRHLKKRFDCEIIELESGEDRALYWAIRESDIMINATPVGLKRNESIPIMIRSLHPRLFVFDAIYAETKLIRTARKQKLRVMHGLGMLVEQGADAFKLWTGKDAPVSVMRKTVEQCLKNIKH